MPTGKEYNGLKALAQRRFLFSLFCSITGRLSAASSLFCFCGLIPPFPRFSSTSNFPVGSVGGTCLRLSSSSLCLLMFESPSLKVGPVQRVALFHGFIHTVVQSLAWHLSVSSAPDFALSPPSVFDAASRISVDNRFLPSSIDIEINAHEIKWFLELGADAFPKGHASTTRICAC